MAALLIYLLLALLTFSLLTFAVDFDESLEGWWGVGDGDMMLAIRQSGAQLSMQAACLMFGRVPAGVNRVDNDRLVTLMNYANQSTAFFQFFEGFNAGCAEYVLNDEWVWMNVDAAVCDSVYFCRYAQFTETVKVTTYTVTSLTATLSSISSQTDTFIYTTTTIKTIWTTSSSIGSSSSSSSSSSINATTTTRTTTSSSKSTSTQTSTTSNVNVCVTARPSLCPQTAGNLFAVNAPAVSRKDAECICGRYPGGQLAVLSYLDLFSPAVQQEVLTCSGLAGTAGLWVGNNACKMATWAPGGIQLVQADCASKAAVLCRRRNKNTVIVDEVNQVCAFGSMKLYVQPLSAPNAKIFCSVLQSALIDVDTVEAPMILMLINFCAQGQGEFWVNSVNGYKPANPMAAKFSNGTFNYGFAIGTTGTTSNRMVLCGQVEHKTLSSGPFPTTNTATSSEYISATSTVSVSTIHTIVSTVTIITSIYTTESITTTL